MIGRVFLVVLLLLLLQLSQGYRKIDLASTLSRQEKRYWQHRRENQVSRWSDSGNYLLCVLESEEEPTICETEISDDYLKMVRKLGSNITSASITQTKKVQSVRPLPRDKTQVCYT